MSRAKKSRKARSERRRKRQLSKLRERFNEMQEFSKELQARADARRQINDSDLHPSVKNALGLFVDPMGWIHEKVVETARDAGLEDFGEEKEMPPWLEDEDG